MTMNPWIPMLTGAGFGAGVMYILDPDHGARRRALVKDQFAGVPNNLQRTASVTARDLRNRSVGFVSEARARLFNNEVTDEVLVDRVRSKLGFFVRHPSAIEVKAQDGRIILSGPVLSDEAEQLINGVCSVRGVRDVENRLEVHAESGSVPGLQGDKPKPTGQPLDVLQQHWSPATRFLIGAASVLLLYSLGRRVNPATVIPGSLVAAILAYRLGDGPALPGWRQRRTRTSRAEPGNKPAGAWSS
jgi:BON domain